MDPERDKEIRRRWRLALGTDAQGDERRARRPRSARRPGFDGAVRIGRRGGEETRRTGRVIAARRAVARRYPRVLSDAGRPARAERCLRAARAQEDAARARIPFDHGRRHPSRGRSHEPVGRDPAEDEGDRADGRSQGRGCAAGKHAPSTTEAIRGALDKHRRTNRPRPRDIDWPRTIRVNLKSYDAERRTIIPERLVGFDRHRRRADLDNVILCVDQSGSMAT